MPLFRDPNLSRTLYHKLSGMLGKKLAIAGFHVSLSGKGCTEEGLAAEALAAESEFHNCSFPPTSRVTKNQHSSGGLGGAFAALDIFDGPHRG